MLDKSRSVNQAPGKLFSEIKDDLEKEIYTKDCLIALGIITNDKNSIV